MAPIHPAELQHQGAGGADLQPAGASFSELVQSSEERLGKDQSYLLESSAMRQVHGWSDQISLQQGLQETLAWVDANLATLRPCPGATSTRHETARYWWLRLQGFSC